MSSATEARALVESIRGHLTGLDVLVTLDPTEAGNSLAAGSAVVIVGPPRVEYPTFGSAEASWEVLLATGPVTDRLEAWEALDEALVPLLEPLAVTSHEPVEYAVGSNSYSAFIIRFTTQFEI